MRERERERERENITMSNFDLLLKLKNEAENRNLELNELIYDVLSLSSDFDLLDYESLILISENCYMKYFDTLITEKENLKNHSISKLLNIIDNKKIDSMKDGKIVIIRYNKQYNFIDKKDLNDYMINLFMYFDFDDLKENVEKFIELLYENVL